MKVPRYDYHSQFERWDEFMVELSAMIVDGHYVLSGEVAEFEHAFAAYLGCSFVVGVNTGTDALLCSLKTLGLQPEDEVITQANTFNATVAAICLAGLKPVLIDADEDSFLMDADQALAEIGRRQLSDGRRSSSRGDGFEDPSPLAGALIRKAYSDARTAARVCEARCRAYRRRGPGPRRADRGPAGGDIRRSGLL